MSDYVKKCMVVSMLANDVDGLGLRRKAKAHKKMRDSDIACNTSTDMKNANGTKTYCNADAVSFTALKKCGQAKCAAASGECSPTPTKSGTCSKDHSSGDGLGGCCVTIDATHPSSPNTADTICALFDGARTTSDSPSPLPGTVTNVSGSCHAFTITAALTPAEIENVVDNCCPLTAKDLECSAVAVPQGDTTGTYCHAGTDYAFYKEACEKNSSKCKESIGSTVTTPKCVDQKGDCGGGESGDQCCIKLNTMGTVGKICGALKGTKSPIATAGGSFTGLDGYKSGNTCNDTKFQSGVTTTTIQTIVDTCCPIEIKCSAADTNVIGADGSTTNCAAGTLLIKAACKDDSKVGVKLASPTTWNTLSAQSAASKGKSPCFAPGDGCCVATAKATYASSGNKISLEKICKVFDMDPNTTGDFNAHSGTMSGPCSGGHLTLTSADLTLNDFNAAKTCCKPKVVSTATPAPSASGSPASSTAKPGCFDNCYR